MHDPAAVLAAARRELAAFPAVLDGLLSGLDPGAWRTRPEPAEWAPVEIVSHLHDEDGEDFGARLRVVIGGGRAFTPIDPERWARERGYLEADGRAVLTAFRTRRAANVAWLDGVVVESLTGTVALARAGSVSGLDLLAAWVAHDRLHLAHLAATLARVWAERWTPLRAEYAGPIPYGAPPQRPRVRRQSS
jgi:hypothetical protein